jgi:menaquinone-dependent protoporphyrinogen IX oxidase
MSKVLILHASQKGSTAEVAEQLAQQLLEANHEIRLANALGYEGDIHRYDAVILGTGIYTGMWLHSMLNTVNRLMPQFQQKPVWGFSLCVRVLEPAGEDYARQFYLPSNLLNKVNLQDYQFFAGRLTNLSVSEKVILADRYDGDFYYHHEGDHRNWNEIAEWGKCIAHQLSMETA